MMATSDPRKLNRSAQYLRENMRRYKRRDLDPNYNNIQSIQSQRKEGGFPQSAKKSACPDERRYQMMSDFSSSELVSASPDDFRKVKGWMLSGSPPPQNW